MNRLSFERRCSVIQALVEGNSIRGTERITGVVKKTILKLLRDVGRVAEAYQDRVLRDLPCRLIQADELWTFVYSKRRNIPPEREGQFGFGDVWTWVAMDAETKLVVTWWNGQRTAEDAVAFMRDLAPRLRNRVQLTTDGLSFYPYAVDIAFGGDVDYGTTIKDFDGGEFPAKAIIQGNPDPKLISTSLIERQNLTMRMEMRRFARRTNAHSKDVRNHAHMVALHYLHYNFARPHMSLSGATPAQAIGLTKRRWRIQTIVRLLAEVEGSPDEEDTVIEELARAGLVDA